MPSNSHRHVEIARRAAVGAGGAPISGGFGDLLVTVEVVIPSPLTDEQRAAVEALAAAIPESPRKHLGVDAE